MKKIVFFAVVVCCFVASSCVATKTRGEQYSRLYDEKPLTLLVLPPINNTTNVEAKELLYTSISVPLIEAGYYVVSPHLAMEMLKAESAYDAELFVNQDLTQFGKVFGTDAVVFSVIDTWQKHLSGITTKIRYIIKSSKTNEIIFERTCELYLDLSASNAHSNSLLGALTNLAVTAIKTASTDHIVAARKCNKYVFQDIPRGQYHPDYQLDKDTKAEPAEVKRTVR